MIPTSHLAALRPIDRADHPDYLERVYAGLLGKLIGVYLGRPMENWSHDRIMEELGEIEYYVHEQRNRLLIITDDDISGTLTFLRALEDYGFDRDLTPAQIGNTWLNYLIDKTTILWWGGMGNSTEHTAYLRLRDGVAAPASGSAALNSKIISEQIGAQIFIDGWGLVCPGNPAMAVDFARRAASVSHDGEAIYGAQVIAAMVAQAFVETDIDKLLDTAVSFIPSNSIVANLIEDVRGWHASGIDWRACRAQLEANYGYDRYRGQCHLIPNHGLIILSLLYGGGDFDESMKIVNTCGWDTDCNSGNVGAILGVRNGLAGLNGHDWRGPMADRLYLPSADPGRAITDAAAESYTVANYGRALIGLNPLVPKDGSKFHFALPGSVQGWQSDHGIARHSDAGLLIQGEGITASTPTFIPPEIKDLVTGYVLVACSTLYPGQTVQGTLIGGGTGAKGSLFISRYGAEDESIKIEGPSFDVGPNETLSLEWTIPDTEGYPIHEIGIALDTGAVILDRMHWEGAPTTNFPPVEGTMWARAWGKAVDRFQFPRDRYEYITHNEGVGLLVQGVKEWTDYRVRARITPRMAKSAGLAVCVQGMRRYYAFVFGEPGEVRLDKMLDRPSSLARVSYPWRPFEDYELCVEVSGSRLRLFIDGELIIQATDESEPLRRGAFACIVDSGCVGMGVPSIEPL